MRRRGSRGTRQDRRRRRSTGGSSHITDNARDKVRNSAASVIVSVWGNGNEDQKTNRERGAVYHNINMKCRHAGDWHRHL